jgi:acyl dehydratase
MATRFADVDVGHDLRTLTLTLSGDEVKHYAVAAHMPGGRFMSDDDARKEGLPGQIVPGNLSLALFSRLIAESLPGATLKKLSATFRGLVQPGRPLVIRGVVTEKHCTDQGDRIECDLILESKEGDRLVTGTATVQFPAHR